MPALHRSLRRVLSILDAAVTKVYGWQWNPVHQTGTVAVLMLIVGSRDPAAWMVWTMVAATVSRYLHAAGMITCVSLAKPHPLRFAGALGTYVCGLALVVAALLVA